VRAETQRLLSLIQSAAIDELPTVIGELSTLLAVAQKKYFAQPAPPEDRLLTPAQAAEKLGVSEKYIYKHAKELGGQNPGGGAALRFSSLGLDKAIRRRAL